ncbi:hypothetical protein GCM10009119_02010 [Algoriphagus jejuensis]|uniref:Uncharacterized protein n=1 Tax=Algoriphagus jejuensis TaxID=419934 RepID=A0ABN1MV08_9BACT
MTCIGLEKEWGTVFMSTNIGKKPEWMSLGAKIKGVESFFDQVNPTRLIVETFRYPFANICMTSIAV